MKYTRRTALGIVGLCLAMMLNTAIAENAWAVDIYPTKIEINDHVPQLNDGSYQEIEKSAYKTSMSADLAKVAVTEMTKTLKAKPEKDTFTSYVRLDKEGAATGEILIVHKGTKRPMEITWQSDCPVNSQFQQTALFALDTDTPEKDDLFKDSEYGHLWGDGAGWVPKFLKPTTAYWARQHHGWVNKYGDKILTKYTHRADEYGIEIVYDKAQVDAYYAAIKQANGKPPVDATVSLLR